MLGSHPEVKSHEHPVQMTLDVVPSQVFQSAAEKGSIPLTGTAGTKICATMFQGCPPQKYFE